METKEQQSGNPFSNAMVAASPTGGNEVMTAVAVNREASEVQAAMILARRFPRDVVAASDRILNACQRPTLAKQALYSYARGGTSITGPSIRLAEALAQAWGNIQSGIRELEQRQGESTVEAYAWDIETNTRASKVFQVKHSRKARGSITNLEDPRDIYELVANQGARRLRACLLSIIPGDVVEAAINQVEKTLHTTVKVTPETIKKMVDGFAEYGVTKEMIEKKIQRRIDTIEPAQMVNLGKIYNSLKDGMSGPADWFETVPVAEEGKPTKGNVAAKDALKKNREPEQPGLIDESKIPTCETCGGAHETKDHDVPI